MMPMVSMMILMPDQPFRHRSSSLLIFGWFLALVGLSQGVPGAAATGWVGRPLGEALRELEAHGLRILYTSHLVQPDLRVLAEPTTSEPRQMLDELLAPHGLAATAGPGGRLVVVAAASLPAGVRGRVRDQGSGAPIAGVRVLIAGTARATSSTADGSFHLEDVTPGSYTLEAHLPGFVVGRFEVLLAPGQTTEAVLALTAAPLALDEIVITPSRVTMLREESVLGLNLDRGDIFALPHFGDDIFRAFTLLPGVSGEETSARFNVRGGRDDEVLVLLDQVELFEPYHLRDFSSRVSIVAPQALREVNLITGGFPAQYGDRMSGVLEMSTVEPERRRTRLGLSMINAELSSSGTFNEQRGHWLAAARHSNLELALSLLDIRERPRYWDAFAKLEYQLQSGQRWGVHLLHSDDNLDFFNLDSDAEEDYLTSYGNSYLWLTHQSILSSRLFVDSVASRGRVDRDRRARELELETEDEDDGFTIFDQRDLQVLGLKQDWQLQAGARNHLQWGFDVRRLVADYDYVNRRELDDLLAAIRSEPRTGTTRFKRRLRGQQRSAYLSDRWRATAALTLELGLRYDEYTLTADRNLSPRFNLVYAAGERSTWRAAWGYFFQSQRPYELEVEDGVTELKSAERTEQRVVGFERAFAIGSRDSDLLLRIEAYQRLITDPRRRYENLFHPAEIFPEIEPDRFLYAPERSTAYGIELFLRGKWQRLEGWVNYTYSRITDRLAGRTVPRRIDQPHALKLDLNYPVGRSWNLNLAWRYHTGWPTTEVSGRLVEDEEGETEVVLLFGPVNGKRLPPYHRLDLRASREWQKKQGVLGFFLELQNVYDRENVAGFDPDEFDLAADVELVAVEEHWDGFLPSFGITWEF